MGGVSSFVDSVYTAHTLLSWDVDTRPGIPTNSAYITYQGLEGTYGGTWTQKTYTRSNNTTFTGDNTSVAWSGAAPAGGEGYSPPTPLENIRSTTYPDQTLFPTHEARMPFANLTTCATQTQTWNYSVHDNGDGSDLALSWKWVCHFPYEGFEEFPPELGGSVSRILGPAQYTQNLMAGESASIPIVAGSLPAKTFYEEATPTYIPNLPHADKFVGIPAYQARAGKTTPNSWSARTYSVTAAQAGEYGVKYSVTWPGHAGFAKAWNSLGESAQQTFDYYLDSESQLIVTDIVPNGGGM